MIRVGIAGATGYTGIELVRLLSQHPEVEIAMITTEQYVGQELGRVYPHLQDRVIATGEALDGARLAECDVVFAALPHGHAHKLGRTVLEAGHKFIDIGADWRLRDTVAYTKWYKVEHTEPDLQKEAAYGLPELYRDQIKGARLVGNPGCYPTTCALAAAPLLRGGVVERRGIIFDSKSGVSGAGRGAKVENLFTEVDEGFKAYSIAGTHRHTPEIEQTLSDIAGEQITINFTPHLLPIVRGILTTGYFTLTRDLSTEDAVKLFREFYAGEPFVRVRPAGDLPGTKQVRGSNFCDIGVQVDRRTGRILVVAVEDNLVKGAAGQAVQNMNLMFGLPETTALHQLPLYP